MNEPPPQPHNADEIGQYQSLSTTAVLALLLGLASPLLFASPIFSVVPICGIAVACLALMKIIAAEGALTGRSLAKAGLALSVAFLLAPMAHSYVRDVAAVGSAERAARNWLLATGSKDWNEAASWMTPEKIYNMIPRSPSPDAPPPKFDRSIAMHEFSHDEVAQAIGALQIGDESDMQFHAHEFNWEARLTEIACTVTLGSGESDLVDCWVLLERNLAPEGQTVWLVKNWKLLSRAD